MNIGGFVGYNTGKIEYSDAYVTAESLVGSHIGGFVGFALENSVIENCTASGEISGTRKTGGFVGVAQEGSFTECEASTDISWKDGSTGNDHPSDFGGFVGEVTQTVNLTKCRAETDLSIIDAETENVGGFAGLISTVSEKTATISRCWFDGSLNIAASWRGGFIGSIAAHSDGIVVIENCYARPNLMGDSGTGRGGLISKIDSEKGAVVTVDCCYAAGIVHGGEAVGGVVGFMNSPATITNCAAWNIQVMGYFNTSNFLSSGAVIGVAWPTATLTDNYRNPSMDLLAYWGTNANSTINLSTSFQHPDVSDSAPLTDPDGAAVSSNSGMRPYQGKCDASKTFLELASTTLGWSSEIWDFTGGFFGWDEFPTLK